MDEQGIADLYQKYAPAVYAHCRKLVGSTAAARDALQESFVRVLQRHWKVEPGDRALHYLFRTSTNVCINLLRQNAVREKAAPAIAACTVGEGGAGGPSPGDRQFVRVLLDHCDETASQIALLYFVDGLTQVEVAATLGITRRTVFNRLRQIERLAAELLEPRQPRAGGRSSVTARS
jgi:RNA polymerase sigma-70 factor, ECF subfamily